jgi:hypothetical protein
MKHNTCRRIPGKEPLGYAELSAVLIQVWHKMFRLPLELHPQTHHYIETFEP